jgi:hypothetical protein
MERICLSNTKRDISMALWLVARTFFCTLELKVCPEAWETTLGWGWDITVRFNIFQRLQHCIWLSALFENKPNVTPLKSPSPLWGFIALELRA